MTAILPSALLSSLQGLPGFDEIPFKKIHEAGEQVISVRTNPLKNIAAQEIFQDNISGQVPWSSNGYYLTKRPVFTLDPLLHAGAYYVQEASSMFLEEAMKQSTDLLQPLKVLDLCAAPGGKSTLIQSIISPESLLVSNEVIKTRVNILAENLSKWGAPNVVVTNNDPQHFQRLNEYFDVIVVDAPCSGSGLFRKDPEAIHEWSENSVQLCSQRQQRILTDTIPALKPGGVLIYSTCSYSKDEDEAIVEWLMDNGLMENIAVDIKADWNIVETKTNGFSGYRFYPDKVKGEGFFIAVFRKRLREESMNEEGVFRKRKEEELRGKVMNEERGFKKRKEDGVSVKDDLIVRKYLKPGIDLQLVLVNDEILALTPLLKNELSVLQSALYIKKAGIKTGSIIRDELIPDHELAVSSIISDAVPFIELDKETAIQYLRRDEIKPTGAGKGWLLVRYRGLPLGWIKALPNRVNNYYPKEWRVRMEG